MKMIRKIVFCAVMTAIICTLLVLFALRGAHVYQLDMSDIDNSRGAVYFANQYGENGGPGFGDVFTPEEQNEILRNLLPSLESSSFDYYLCAQSNYSGVNVTIINQHTANLAKLSDSIAEGQDISYSVTIDSGDNPVIPVLIGSELAADYSIGDTIPLQISADQSIGLIVSGVLKAGTFLDEGSLGNDFDSCAVMPEIQFGSSPSSDDELELQNTILQSECQGYFLYSPESGVTYEDIKSFCDSLTNEYKIEWGETGRIENMLEGVTLPLSEKICTLLIVAILAACCAFLLLSKIRLPKQRDGQKPIQTETGWVIKESLLFAIFTIIAYLLCRGFAGSRADYFLAGVRGDVILAVILFVLVRSIRFCIAHIRLERESNTRKMGGRP
ncbi:MAG: hypothetical protein LKG48_09680 [Lachnospiraceae bacterium]|jgi:hypothetical protein|nr:hypothetical protein [Lachnospiraceae bacterium]MCI1334510.1 hypothetical protein [Lachnospiraceae bacterium]MCI1455463.1 hypothetical protein [Lachnospiraceae bacterium]